MACALPAGSRAAPTCLKVGHQLSPPAAARLCHGLSSASREREAKPLGTGVSAARAAGRAAGTPGRRLRSNPFCHSRSAQAPVAVLSCRLPPAGAAALPWMVPREEAESQDLSHPRWQRCRLLLPGRSGLKTALLHPRPKAATSSSPPAPQGCPSRPARTLLPVCPRARRRLRAAGWQPCRNTMFSSSSQRSLSKPPAHARARRQENRQSRAELREVVALAPPHPGHRPTLAWLRLTPGREDQDEDRVSSARLEEEHKPR